MYVATYEKGNHKFDVSFDIDSVTNDEQATAHATGMISSMGLIGYNIVSLKSMSLEEYYRMKGRQTDNIIDKTVDDDDVSIDDVVIVPLDDLSEDEEGLMVLSEME